MGFLGGETITCFEKWSLTPGGWEVLGTHLSVGRKHETDRPWIQGWSQHVRKVNHPRHLSWQHLPGVLTWGKTEQRMLRRWETTEIMHVSLEGRESKTGAFHTAQDEHSCFIYTFQGRFQRYHTDRLRCVFPLLNRVVLRVVTLGDKSPENSHIPWQLDTYNYTYSWETGGEFILFHIHMRLTLLFTWTEIIQSRDSPKTCTSRDGAKGALKTWLCDHICREGAFRRYLTSCLAPHFSQILLIKIKLLEKYHYQQNSGSDLEWGMQRRMQVRTEKGILIMTITTALHLPSASSKSQPSPLTITSSEFVVFIHKEIFLVFREFWKNISCCFINLTF